MRRTSVFILLGFLGLIYGAGSAHGTDAQPEGESWLPHVTYRGQHFVKGGQQFSVFCNLTLFSQLKWTHNGKPVVSGEGGYTMEDVAAPQGYVGSRLSVKNALMYHAGEYKCTSFSPRSHMVYVLSVDTTGGDAIKMLYIGFPLSISCNMTNLESTTLQLEWSKNDIKLESNDRIKIFQENSSIYIAEPSRDDVGEYKCQTAGVIAGDNPLHKIIQVIFLEIRKMDKSKVVTEGGELIIECPVEGHPPPGIQWYKDAELIADAINGTQLTLQPNDKEMPNGLLKVTGVQLEHRGNYTCAIISKTQKYERSMFVRVKSVYAALWPFLGILVEMIVLGIIIFIFEKRRAKAEFDESDTDQGNDQKADNNRGQRRK
ncbi:neuroplastin-like isoform X1 [Penaeus monodon]|uniref:neuroplastin-like isoform X1 n=1 Tax=Penaeus monodon TaxID=6687 RepID=UPI0018A79A5C|nr:neuroplastin-like isoform X1 [Penaeus monodon]